MAEEAAVAAKPAKKRKIRPKAIIWEEGCTGCMVCVDFCPVDCIDVVPGSDHARVQAVCRVEWERCTGCTICARECPWETIEMVLPTEAAERDGYLAEA